MSTRLGVEHLPAAEAALLRLVAAERDLDRAVLELRDFAERIERGIGQNLISRCGC